MSKTRTWGTGNRYTCCYRDGIVIIGTEQDRCLHMGGDRESNYWASGKQDVSVFQRAQCTYLAFYCV